MYKSRSSIATNSRVAILRARVEEFVNRIVDTAIAGKSTIPGISGASDSIALILRS